MKETEFEDFAEALGQWFLGFAKFALLVARHSESFYTGEIHMIERLAAASMKVDLHLKQLRQNLHEQQVRQREKVLEGVRERLLSLGKVGEALSMSAAEFHATILTADERDDWKLDPEKWLAMALYQPLQAMLSAPHRLNCLSDDIPSRLLVAAVNDGVVSVALEGSVTRVVMEGALPRLEDAFSLAELLHSDRSFTICLGGLAVSVE